MKRKMRKEKEPKVLTAAQVRKLPYGAKVVRRTEERDQVCTVAHSGKFKKLLYHDKWHGSMKWMPITDKDCYMEMTR